MAKHNTAENLEIALGSIARIQESLSKAIDFQEKKQGSSPIVAKNNQVELLKMHNTIFTHLRNDLIERQQELLPQYRQTLEAAKSSDQASAPATPIANIG